MKRSEVEKKYLWQIEDMYADNAAWQKEYDEVNASVASLSEYAGKLGDKEEFLKFNRLNDEIMKKIEKIYTYAHMMADSDSGSSENCRLIALAQRLYVYFSTTTAFTVPEILSLPDEKINEYINDPDLKDYDYQLKTLLKSKKHVLSKDLEEMLSGVSEVTSSFMEIFQKLDNVDLPLKPVEYDGEEYPLSHGCYSLYMQSPDRDFRKEVYNAYYAAYGSVLNTLTSIYYGNVKNDVFFAKAKKYDGCLEMALSNEDVDKRVYENLLEAVNKGLPTLHEYIAAKKKALDIDGDMYMYDMYVPVVEDADMKMKYDDAYDYVVKALAPLGKDYQNLLKKAHDERWIDVYETEGKRSGAYSTGCYLSHPYVLLNYTETTHDVFTIAHEMGHSIHTYFSSANQPYAKADYKIFVAEVASTVNEVLLHRYILNNVKDEKVKKYILSYFLEMIRTTLFRQTQFAEFEYEAHNLAFNGEPLTKDTLNKLYGDLNKKYYGEAVVTDDNISTEWARIPHFYTSFYVYKYATGITSALVIADRILTEGEPAVKDYFKFLSSGSSDSPVELLKIAGVDLNKPQVFEKAMNMFKEYLDEFNKLN
ncbi:MAG: oligoendopeptidase F [Clostridia bacterium]|nr:oligoendopeptidase F [Clostridia bacterium]